MCGWISLTLIPTISELININPEDINPCVFFSHSPEVLQSTPRHVWLRFRSKFRSPHRVGEKPRIFTSRVRRIGTVRQESSQEGWVKQGDWREKERAQKWGRYIEDTCRRHRVGTTLRYPYYKDLSVNCKAGSNSVENSCHIGFVLGRVRSIGTTRRPPGFEI